MILRWARYAVALLEGLRDEADRRHRLWVCSSVGHQPSWTRAVRLGITDRPVCARCDEPLGYS